jgi:nucleoside transporter
MFLQFFIWGAWYVTAGTFVPARGWSHDTIFWVYSAGPIAAIVSPIFLGLVADRYFATERVLAVMHLLGGALMLAVPSVAAATTRGADGAFDTGAFEGLILAYMLCYMPTLGLTNTLAFHHIEDRQRQFPLIRVFGTLGWIAAGIVVSKLLHADQSERPFYVAGGASVLLGLLAFWLPHTPPPAAGRTVSVAETLGLGALPLLRSPSFAVFLLASFLICIPLAGYYSYGSQFTKTAFADPAFVMGFGQWAEVVFMLLMPACFARLGVKWMLAIGMLAWLVRYGLFSSGAGSTGQEPVAWMVLAGILLHGICYDFFFVTGQIHVDQQARPNIRAQAQALLVVLTQGVGMLIGTRVITEVVKANTAAGGAPDWAAIWRVPALAAAAVLALFLLLFRPPAVEADASARRAKQ